MNKLEYSKEDIIEMQNNRLQQENKKLNMQLDQALKDYDEEMQKNMKAIEYIEEDYKRIKGIQIGLPIEIDTSMPIYDDLLEILKGDSND